MGERPDGQITVEMHNNLVRHTFESLTQLSVVDQRVVAYLVGKGIKDAQVDYMPEFIEGSVNELAQIAGLSDRSGSKYRLVREATESLMRQLIRFKDPDTNHQVSTTWLAEGVYKEGKGTFEVQFSRSMRKLLTALSKQRTVMQLETILGIGGSNYAIRLYQLLKSYESLEYWTTRIDTLREMMGVPDDAYKRWDSFRSKVIDYPLAKINERTDLKVSYDKQNKGRQWTHIAFHIQPGTKKSDIKKAEKVEEWEIWWDDKCETDAGQDEIWAVAYRIRHEIGLDHLPESRGSAILSGSHSLHAFGSQIWMEAAQMELPHMP